ncbi:MAG: hypothetical protein RMY36_030920 [Nostoc sp. SerVER01]|nr:hypothetical protein [Nostoc sp. SerVER01]
MALLTHEVKDTGMNFSLVRSNCVLFDLNCLGSHHFVIGILLYLISHIHKEGLTVCVSVRVASRREARRRHRCYLRLVMPINLLILKTNLGTGFFHGGLTGIMPIDNIQELFIAEGIAPSVQENFPGGLRSSMAISENRQLLCFFECILPSIQNYLLTTGE